MSRAVDLRGVSKSYGDTLAVRELDLTVQQGEIVALIGPSGCGKSTLLRLVAGLERPDAGTVTVGDRVVAGQGWVPPERRRVGLVFQEHALFPHLTSATTSASASTASPAREQDARVARSSTSSTSLTSSTATRTSSPAASSSAWRWPGPSRPAPRSSCSTSRSPRSTSRCAPGSGPTR